MDRIQAAAVAVNETFNAALTIFSTGYDPATECADAAIEIGLKVVQEPYNSETFLEIVREALDFQYSFVEVS